MSEIDIEAILSKIPIFEEILILLDHVKNMFLNDMKNVLEKTKNDDDWAIVSNFIEQNTTSDPSVLSLLIVRSSKKPDILKDESQKLINHFLFVKKKTLFYQ